MNAMNQLKQYSDVGFETSVRSADAHRLILLLFQGALLAISAARNHLQRKEIPLKGKSISQAISIIDEGLKASLNMDVGGDMVKNLSALYGYMSRRLFQANLQNSVEILDEVTGLLAELKSAWEGIGKAPVVVAKVERQEEAADAAPAAAPAAGKLKGRAALYERV